MGVPKKQLDDAIGYIRDTPQVRDVLISGGDGLLINDKILEYVLKNLPRDSACRDYSYRNESAGSIPAAYYRKLM